MKGKPFKRIAAAFMALAMVGCALPSGSSFAGLLRPEIVASAEASGDCNENVSWSLDDSGKLTISGTGAMPDYPFQSDIPWYDNKDQIITVEVGNGITKIGDHAFHSCTSLSSVTIPASVTSIGESVFAECTALTSLTIPDSVTSIGRIAFGGCESLRSAVIPAGVTSISDYLFADCPLLETVTIPFGVTSIGNNAFDNCSSLTSVIIPKRVESIGDNAFLGCTACTDVYCLAGPYNFTWNIAGTDFKSDKQTKCHVYKNDPNQDNNASQYNTNFPTANVVFVDDIDGECGGYSNTIAYNAFYTLDTTTHKLTVFGTGAMINRQIWENQKDSIYTVEIK